MKIFKNIQTPLYLLLLCLNLACTQKRDLTQNVLDLTGPCLLGRKLEHLNIFKTTKFELKDKPSLTINYGNEIFMKAYDTYKEEREQVQQTKHYAEIYHNNSAQVWCKNT
jgi:hypothetical protein